MIQMQTVLEAADNSGAKNLRCIKSLADRKNDTQGLETSL